jgi:hypothetical protein
VPQPTLQPHPPTSLTHWQLSPSYPQATGLLQGCLDLPPPLPTLLITQPPGPPPPPSLSVHPSPPPRKPWKSWRPHSDKDLVASCVGAHVILQSLTYKTTMCTHNLFYNLYDRTPTHADEDLAASCVGAHIILQSLTYKTTMSTQFILQFVR